jgi:hypothetical protein
MTQAEIRKLPGARSQKSRRVFVVYKNPLFNDLVAQLFRTSDEVIAVGRSDNVAEASRLLLESKADVVLVEGDPASAADMTLLNYLIMSAAAGVWSEMILVSVDGRDFATYYRGSIKHLSTRRLLSLILAG